MLKTVPFKTILFSISISLNVTTKFNCQKHFYFNLFSLFKQFYFKQFIIA